MLRHDIRVERGGVSADFDLKVARRVSGVERTEKWQQRIEDNLATAQHREIDPELLAGWAESPGRNRP